MERSPSYRSATQGRARTAISVSGKRARTARMAGSDITASPSQLVARIRILENVIAPLKGGRYRDGRRQRAWRELRMAQRAESAAETPVARPPSRRNNNR